MVVPASRPKQIPIRLVQTSHTNLIASLGLRDSDPNSAGPEASPSCLKKKTRIDGAKVVEIQPVSTLFLGGLCPPPPPKPNTLKQFVSSPTLLAIDLV